MPPFALFLSPLPALTDNYVWLLHEGQAGRRALAVDPGDAAPLEQALDAQGLSLDTILVTHHHGDHTAGLARLRQRWPAVRVIGPARESIDLLTDRVAGGARFEALGQSVHVLDVPGHTAGHIAFFIDNPSDHSPPILFCGDTLFAAGCGRLFEGTPAQMQHSLAQLTALPPTTRVCCTHEYTLDNIRFALTVEPENPALLRRQSDCQALRQQQLPTLPSTLDLEQATNPFLRWSEPSVIQAAMCRAPQPAMDDDPVSVFAALRSWKNVFR
jgi:hydroxyacylglutathione hydrolase